IPADQASWGQSVELRERNAAILREILEKASVDTAGRDAITQKIGDYYSSCMDEKAVELKGLDPLKPELDRIAATKDKAALIEAIARVHLIGPNPLFNFYSSSDLHNANQVIAYLDQRPVAPRPGLLHQRRRQDGGCSQEPGRVRYADVHSGRPISTAGRQLGAVGVAH